MKVEFYISAKETKQVKKLITKASGVNNGLGTFHTIAVFFSSLFIGFSLMQIIPYTMRVYVVFPVYIVCLGVLVFGIFIYFVSRWYVGKKIIEKTGLQKAKITYEILPNKIIRLTDDGLKQEILPCEIKKFIEIKGFLLIFVRENLAYYIPPSAFPDETSRDKCRNELRELLKNC